MANLRIIYDNAIDRATSLTAVNAGSLVIANTQTDRKSKIWRSTGITATTITATWNTAELVSGLIMPFCSLTATGTVQVRGYDAVSGGTLLFDTGAVIAAPYAALGQWTWGSLPLGVNAYSYGYNTYGRCWFNNTYSVKRLEIVLTDSANASGYMEVGRLVTGVAWSPTYNTGYGLPVSFSDTSTHERTESGDLVTTLGTRFKRLSFDLNWMNTADRQHFNLITRNNGMTKSLYISLFPDDPDTEKEQTYQIYGRMPSVPQMTHTTIITYASQIEIEEI